MLVKMIPCGILIVDIDINITAVLKITTIESFRFDSYDDLETIYDKTYQHHWNPNHK